MKKTKCKLIATFIIIAILMSNLSGILSSVVYAANNYTITFEGAHLGNGEDANQDNNVIYYYFEETYFDQEAQQEKVNKQYIRARIEKNTPEGWMATNVFATSGENQTATLLLENGEDINTKYRINFEGDITQNYNVLINGQKVDTENLQIVKPNPDPSDDYLITVINMPITDGMKINFTKRIIKTIEFNGSGTLKDSTTVTYTDGENEVDFQIGTRTVEPENEHNYIFTPISIKDVVNNFINEQNEEEVQHHIQAEIENSFSGYYLKMINPNQVGIEVWVDGKKLTEEDAEFDEENTIAWASLEKWQNDFLNIDIRVGNAEEPPPQPQPQVEPPTLKNGYLTASFRADEHATGQINYFFVNSQGKYLSKTGTVLTEQKEPAGAITIGDELKEVLIPTGTKRVLIGIESGESSDFINPTLYINNSEGEGIENIEKDNINHGRTMEIPYSEGDSIGLAIFFEFRRDYYSPENKGTYLIADFMGNDGAVVKYTDTGANEQTLTNNTHQVEDVISMPRTITMQISDNQMDHLQINVFDEELNLITGEAGDIALLLADEQDETKNFEAWIGKLIAGEKAILDLSLLNEDYSFVIELRLKDPNEQFKAHVLTWTNMKGSGWGDDALIDGGFARLVQAKDNKGNVIWDINEEYDESHYVKDDRGNVTDKFFYGEKMEYGWERGPMYPFAIYQNKDGGEIEAVEGIELVMEFTPVYGKQLVGVSLGETIGTAEDGNINYYKLKMPANHVHFNAKFDEVQNEKLLGADSKVTEMTYTLDDKALDSGTAVLSIDKVENLSNAQKEAFAKKAGNNYTVSTYLDVDLTQVWFKGTEANFDSNTGYSSEDIWSKEVYDLGDKKATITIKLDEGITPDDVIILHELHDEKGQVTGYEAVTIIKKEKAENGIWTITFETSKFSNYAVATRTYKVYDYKEEFTDVKPTDWYYNAVKYVYENNIIKGYNATTFAPNDKLTRGQLVTILHRMEGSPKITGTPKFSDVQDSSQYYYNAVKWATDNKIVSGYDNGKFGPEDNITREQLAVILWKYAKYKGKDVSASNDLKGFGDTSKISSWATSQVKWAVGAGVITGNNNTNPPTINPFGNATRAEVAAMLEKYCKKVGR